MVRKRIDLGLARSAERSVAEFDVRKVVLAVIVTC